MKKKRDLGKLSVAIGDHLDLGAFTAHGLAPLPHHKDAAGRKKDCGQRAEEKQSAAARRTDVTQPFVYILKVEVSMTVVKIQKMLQGQGNC